MHYILQASAFAKLWSSVDRGADSWKAAETEEFECNLHNALLNRRLRATSQLGYEITPSDEQQLDELFVTLEDCIRWMNRSSFQGVPDDEFEFAYELGLDVIIDNSQPVGLGARVLPPRLDSLIRGGELIFSVEQRLPPNTEAHKNRIAKVKERLDSPEAPQFLNSQEYRGLLNWTPPFVILMRRVSKGDKAEQLSNINRLATREQLIRAFQQSAGVEAFWFKDFSRVSMDLKAARVVAGGHGRGASQPLFCPYLFALYLLNPRRQMGRKISLQKVWMILEKSFPLTYKKYAEHDPRGAIEIGT